MYGYYGGYGGWGDYVSVAERKKRAAEKIAALQKSSQIINPIRIEGRSIAKTFWGKSWCDNLETYSDFESRLPRGRSYVRNGLVIDLQIGKGEISALVSGSSVYKVKISISALEEGRWRELINLCTGQIDSLVELLQGKFSRGVMEVMTSKERGLFPSPRQIDMNCSCPDGAYMCKHIAATLYGVGARLDESPELLFRLRNVDHAELITAVSTAAIAPRIAKTGKVLKSKDLSGIFGIDVDIEETKTPPVKTRKKISKKAGRKPSKSKAAKLKTKARRGRSN